MYNILSRLKSSCNHAFEIEFKRNTLADIYIGENLIHIVTKVDAIPAKDDNVPKTPEKNVGNFPAHKKPLGSQLTALSKSREFLINDITSNISLSSNCRIDFLYSAAEDVLKCYQ